MIGDERTTFADKTALVTTGTGKKAVGNTIPLDVAGRNLGAGDPIFLVIKVDVDLDSAGDAATCQFILASDAQDPLADDGTATEHFATPVYPQATLVAGFARSFPLPSDFTYETHLGLLQNVAEAAATAGKITAFLTADVPKWAPYASGM